jgi:hypothetical protein
MEPHQVLADAVDRVRAGQPVPKLEPLTPEQARLQKLAKDEPSMPVQLPGDDQTITLSDALERIQREREFDESEATLLRVAVTCALESGA